MFEDWIESANNSKDVVKMLMRSLPGDAWEKQLILLQEWNIIT
jgi:hypothetical protein